MTPISKAMAFAIKAHKGQARKYTQDPYWKHLAEVAGMVSSASEVTEEMVMASWLHDVVEDTDVTLDDVRETFGEVVAEYVNGLTEVSTARDGNRHARKAKDRAFLATQCGAVHTIKYADILSNVASIVVQHPEFAKRYCLEKKAAMDVMIKGDSTLRSYVDQVLRESIRLLNVTNVEAYLWWKKQPTGQYNHQLISLQALNA